MQTLRLRKALLNQDVYHDGCPDNNVLLNNKATMISSTRFRRTLLFFAILGGLIMFIRLFPTSHDPLYQGKPISDWLLSEDDTQPERILRQVGTNAVPCLLRMLRVKDSAVKTNLMALLHQQHFIHVNFIPAGERNYRAALGFGILGPSAYAAVSNLADIYDQRISVESQCLTADSLGAIGPAATNAILALLKGLNSNDAPVRWNTIWALGQIHGEPDVVVPALTQTLHDPEWKVRRNAAQALAAFGLDARNVIPTINELLQDTNTNVILAASTAMQTIDSAVAAKASPK